MKIPPSTYYGFRHPGEIISHAVWLYHRFTLSFRNVEEILVSRGVDVTYESIRQWCLRFGQAYAYRIRAKEAKAGDTWYLDEVFIKIQGQTALPVACGGSGWRCLGYFGPTTA